MPTASAAPGQAVVEPTSQSVTVSSKADILRVLERINTPTRILLRPGNYGRLFLKDIAVPNGTVIQSAEMRRVATFEGIRLDGVRGLSFEGLGIEPPASGPVAGRYGMLIVNSRSVEVDRLAFRGPGRTVNDRFGAALMLRNSSSITVKRSYFKNFRHGIAMLKLEDATIELNEFEELQTDAIRGGGVSDTRIANNVITNFSPAAKDHPDGIQLWSNQQRKAAKDIVIEDNLVVRGKGGPTQGVFIRDNRLRLPFENLRVTGNLVIGGLYNGISIGGADGVRLLDNTVISRPDQKSWIRLEHTRNTYAAGNSAAAYVVKNNPMPPKVRNNELTDPVRGDLTRTISEWVRSKEGFATYRGAVLQRLMKRGE
ncbi:right-handed parallel beta-helix repeat-containing protein [Erythrobacter litoralis]|uniref:right-handed parallel beta-helix repeat-containing protein n=1 Tax=Erythrobacter litoralis TaxID=39960 RepID=UPI0024357FA8|nr:right-handed parallel beta-helix repeat-containing protein [Erythrobacter litoralis]MDG6079097.1 right-handed parallel beta-helix repeat-containing protein [Erythrobacter litoralis]